MSRPKREAVGRWFRGIEIGVLTFGLGGVYTVYGGLIGWFPFGFDPHFPQQAVLLVYLMSLGIAIMIDFIAHPALVKEIYRDIRRGDESE